MNNKILIANPMLIGAMELIKKDKSPENLRVFMDELLHAKLLSPVVITPPPTVDENGKKRLTPENKVSVPMVPGPEGKKYFMAFTDLKEVKKMKADGKMDVFGFNFQDYAVMIAKADDKCEGLVINPKSNALIVNKAMIGVIMNSIMKKEAENADQQKQEQSEKQQEQTESKTEE